MSDVLSVLICRSQTMTGRASWAYCRISPY